ncbi:MAG: DUF892 family protein [Chitinophagaceae bacterium]
MCKGMEGLITEGEKIMKADITDEALDAAIIASAQKIEHYEICGYGTARAFARELQLTEVERLLTQTLNEEYTSDDMLTELAVGKLNLKAEHADGMEDNRSRSGRTNRLSSSTSSNGSSSKEEIILAEMYLQKEQVNLRLPKELNHPEMLFQNQEDHQIEML